MTNQAKAALPITPCWRWPALQKMTKVKHQISPMSLLTMCSPWDFEGKQCLPAGPACERGTWQPPTMSLPKMPSSWFCSTSCSPDLVSAHSSIPFPRRDRQVQDIFCKCIGSFDISASASCYGEDFQSQWLTASPPARRGGNLFKLSQREMALVFLLQQLTY